MSGLEESIQQRQREVEAKAGVMTSEGGRKADAGAVGGGIRA